jgi:aryl-alcohol dehydrogenase-like predicted oxidoreductase
MEYRQFGQTGLQVSALGFGCGAVGGLLVRGQYNDMVRTIGHAIDAGITYFDTARAYGNGRSEENLGRVLKELKPDVIVGTKVQLRTEEINDIESAVVSSVEGSLQRLQKDTVDLIQLHNRVSAECHPEKAWLSEVEVEQALNAFQRLQQQGKVRHFGMNGLGDTQVLHHLIKNSAAETIQSCYNLINPSAGIKMQSGFPFQDYECLIDRAAEQNMAVMAIRILAAGALSGSAQRHPNAAQNVGPIATGSTFAEDVTLAQRFNFLVEYGYTQSLVEAAIRFAISKTGISTALVGISNKDQLIQAVTAANKGPLPDEVFSTLRAIWNNSIQV